MKDALVKVWLMYVLLLLSACSPSPEIVQLSGATMGTTYHISLVAREGDNPERLSKLQRQVDTALDSVN